MMQTIRHQDSGKAVVIAKLLMGYNKITEKVTDPESYIKANSLFDAEFTAFVVSWQSNHSITGDGVIGPKTWAAIAKAAPTCSTSKNRISGYTMALQILLDTNITCDGIFGSRTKAAVVAYQDAKGLKADGKCGPKTWEALLTDTEEKPDSESGSEAPSSGSTDSSTGTTTKVTFKQPVDYKQGNSKWGSKIYSNHNSKSQTMANSGCGPTACADVVATLKDKSVTPWTLAQLYMKWGYRTDNSGTAWGAFKKTAEYYKFSKFVQSSSWSALTACLDAGGYVVCSMGPGYWTKGGHFICAWKYDKTYIYCNDPASSSRKKQKISEFKQQRKQYFCFYPDAKPTGGNTDTGNKDTGSTETKPENTELKRGSKICDISKYQPTIDYDEFIADTALVIMRAGYRGTAGGIHEDQKFELHSEEMLNRGCRFGVYFYSIATNEDMAREEARMFYKYAKDKNPLFWAVDVEKDSITNKAIAAFADEMRKLGMSKIGCYCANHLYQKFDYDTLRDKFDFTWIPRYGSTPPKYKCDLWQYTSTGSVGGISGNVDLNKITGDGRNLEWFCQG